MSLTMSDGCLLRALVRGLMKDEFLQSDGLAATLRPVYDGPPGEGALRSIAPIYDNMSTQDAKDALRDTLLRAEHLRPAFDRDGLRGIVELYVFGGGEEDASILQSLIGTIVDHLLPRNPAETFLFGEGLPSLVLP